MRIATMVRGILPVPRPHDIMYSPLDVAVGLSERLVKRGHEVTFYAPEGSHLDVTRVRSCNLHPIIHSNQELQDLVNTHDLFMDYIPSLYDQVLVQDMFQRARRGEFDLLHFHHPESAMPCARLHPDVPVVYTLHDQLDALRKQTMEAFVSPNQHFISISNNQRRGAPSMDYVATVYNGIDTDLFKPDGPREDYLLYVGRIVPAKGIKEAVRVAQLTNSRLFLIGALQDADREYFNTFVAPHLNDKIVYLGHMPHEQTVRYFQKARAFLMPILWEEPFGLTIAEAMACGTPVIGFRRGSIPELVIDGKTGFIVNDVKEMAKAVGKLDAIKHSDCRRHVEKKFSINRMVDGYETAFRAVIESHKTGKIQRTLRRTVHQVTRPIVTIRPGKEQEDGARPRMAAGA